MPAPDLETIFDVEEAIESAAKAVLQTYGIDAYMQRETEELPANRVDVQLQLGPQTGHRGKMNDGNFVRDAWEGTLVFNIWTARTAPDADGKPVAVPRTTHGHARAKLRIACEYFSNKFNADLLPYHVLTSITHANADPTVSIEDDVELSVLHYNVVISVRTGAWPEVAP